MIYILIPFKRESLRLKSKNLMLLPFTLRWLENEVASLDRQVQIYTFGSIDEEQLKAVQSFGVKHIQLEAEEDSGHLAALHATIHRLKISPDDIIVQLQVTQPRRESGLLAQVIGAVEDNPNLPVITATRVKVDNRLVGQDGLRLKTQPDELLLYDGGVYGGTIYTVDNWFTLRGQSTVLTNGEMSVVDIDTLEDLLEHTEFRY